MAVLQKIRNRGAILVGAVGLALFAVIAEEAVRSLQSTANENRQKVGEVFGKSLSVQEYNEMIDEYAEFEKASRGLSQLDEQALYRVRENAWNSYVQFQIVKHECDEVGLAVSDAEVQDAVMKGGSQWLQQFAYLLGMGGRYDYSVVRQVIDQYNTMESDPALQGGAEFDQIRTVYNLWLFVEKRVREELLMQKFGSLLQASVAPDAIAKAAFDERISQYDVVLAALPYSSIADETIEVSDADMKAKYDEYKPLFLCADEEREAEVISVTVTASEADRTALLAEMNEVAATIGEATNMAKAVREAGSSVAYSTLPVSRRHLPYDIAQRLDSMQAGQVAGPFTSNDNTMNVVRLLAKVSQPDSIEFRQIVVGGADIAAARKTADSIVAAINSGTPFDTIAAQKNQPADKQWLTGAQYEGQAVTGDNLTYLNTLLSASAGSLQVLELPNVVLVINVTDRRAMTDKYDVAIVKRAITFSKETYTEAYNKLSQFLAENQTADAIRENAPKKNYSLQTVTVSPKTDRVAGIAATRATLRWLMDGDTDINAVSELYECGDNDNLMVAILKGVTPKGYYPVSATMVDAYLRPMVLRDKKYATLSERVAAKSFAEVSAMEGAKVDTVRHITFAGNVFVPAISASESSLSGALAGKKIGDEVKGVKGDAAVYTVKVIGTNKSAETYDEAAERNRAAMSTTGMAMQGLMERLLEKAEVVDHRYIFY